MNSFPQNEQCRPHFYQPREIAYSIFCRDDRFFHPDYRRGHDYHTELKRNNHFMLLSLSFLTLFPPQKVLIHHQQLHFHLDP